MEQTDFNESENSKREDKNTESKNNGIKSYAQAFKNSSRKGLIFSIFLAVCLGIVIANVAGGYIASLLSGLLSSLTAFVSALVIIFILKHLMDFIENKLLKNFLTDKTSGFTIKRIISIIISFATLFLFVFLIMKLIIPRIIEIASELINNRETYIYQVQSQLTTFVSSLIGTQADDTVNGIMTSISSYLEETFNEFLPQLVAFSTTTIMTIGQILMGALLAFLYLLNRETVNSFFARLLKTKCKEATVTKTYRIMNHSDKVLLDYIVAKIIEAIIITVVVGVGLSIFNVKYAFELALILGILNVIPYIGFLISLVPLVFITIIYGSVDLAIQALIVTAVLYIFLTTFITPFIVGKKIKINMLLMFSAMLIGGGMFGIVGMAISAPVACIIAEIFKERLGLDSQNPVKQTQNDNENNDNKIETFNE